MTWQWMGEVEEMPGQLRVRECMRLPDTREGGEADGPPEPPAGASPAHALFVGHWSPRGLVSDSWSPELQEYRGVLFGATMCVVMRHSSNRKLIQFIND